MLKLPLFAQWFSGRDATPRERNQRTLWCALIAALLVLRIAEPIPAGVINGMKRLYLA